MGTLAIWSPDQSPEPIQVQRIAWVGRGGVGLGEQVEEQLGKDVGAAPDPVPAGSVAILPLDPPDEGAVLLVPEDRTTDAFVNRIPVGPGLHLLRHGDRLEVSGARFWVEVRAVAEPTGFDPQRHGSDVFCAVTRARLETGDQIVVCPGGQGKACGLIYLRAAWEARPSCHGCGSSRSPETWSPPEDPASSRLAELLASRAGASSDGSSAPGSTRDGEGR